MSGAENKFPQYILSELLQNLFTRLPASSIDDNDDCIIEKVTKDTSAIIGLDSETESLVRVGEEERCGGLYILGKPRTGKSNLLISMALSDIANGYGILFIDSHTDAINDLRARIPESRKEDIILLDPTDSMYSFGINLLECEDRTNPLAIEETWARVRDVFLKVWGDEKDSWASGLKRYFETASICLLKIPIIH